eukprot:UN00330
MKCFNGPNTVFGILDGKCDNNSVTGHHCVDDSYDSMEGCCSEEDRCPEGGSMCTSDLQCDTSLICDPEFHICVDPEVITMEINFAGDYDTIFNKKEQFLKECTNYLRLYVLTTSTHKYKSSCSDVRKGSIQVEFEVIELDVEVLMVWFSTETLKLECCGSYHADYHADYHVVYQMPVKHNSHH